MNKVIKVKTLVDEFEACIRNRVNDLDAPGQASYGFGYLLGTLQALALDNPKLLQDLQNRVDFMKGY